MADDSMSLVIRTGSPNWLPALANAYKARASVHLIDDGNIGVDPVSQTLLEMGRKANLSQREWLAVLVSLGVGVAGAALLAAAILDPEPFSKIAIALVTGAVLIAGGGFSAVRVLVGHKPPNVKVSPRGGFEISWPE